jgi:hypothetical protein
MKRSSDLTLRSKTDSVMCTGAIEGALDGALVAFVFFNGFC